MMDWQTIATITPEAGHVLFFGNTRHDAGVAFTGWVAQNGRLYSDADGLSCRPTHWMPMPDPPHTKEAET